MQLPPSLLERLSFWFSHIPEEFFPLYLVGGSVRDLLLERPFEDVDFALRGARELFDRLRHKPAFATVVMGARKAKTCYRLVHRGNVRNYIDLCEIEGESIEEDLSRRDFTLNAVAIELDRNVSVKRLVDVFGGQDHISRKEIVCLGERAFQDDPLRMIRAFRFSCLLGFAIDGETFQAVREHSPLIQKVSAERVREELFRILECPNATATIREMDKSGLLGQVFPEIFPMRGCEQNEYHHLDVWEHSLLTLENCEKVLSDLNAFYPGSCRETERFLASNRRKPLLKFAALFHDVAKPECRETNEAGKYIFHGHEEKGAEVVEVLAKRLRFSTQDTDFLAMLVREHLHVKVLQNDEVRENTRIRWFNRFKDKTAVVTLLGMADMLSKNPEKVSDEATDEYRRKSDENLTNYFTKYRKVFRTKPLITGEDLIKLGLKPGKAFKGILNEVREAQLNGSISTRKQALALAEKHCRPL